MEEKKRTKGGNIGRGGGGGGGNSHHSSLPIEDLGYLPVAVQDVVGREKDLRLLPAGAGPGSTRQPPRAGVARTSS